MAQRSRGARACPACRLCVSQSPHAVLCAGRSPPARRGSQVALLPVTGGPDPAPVLGPGPRVPSTRAESPAPGGFTATDTLAHRTREDATGLDGVAVETEGRARAPAWATRKAPREGTRRPCLSPLPSSQPLRHCPHIQCVVTEHPLRAGAGEDLRVHCRVRGQARACSRGRAHRDHGRGRPAAQGRSPCRRGCSSGF